ncbi:glycoside hydrolase family 3 protein [Hyphomonas johnsonii]|uniref:Glycoside hydrolase family protein n=1 Tax=Hyphomonas johnsonii MHS-2 TaxID=1280950 RepID=A0A059FS44_9PROT|nr:glycoside hydrolase family 3 protein [Hyphomonas johnsonii]KCZ93341.1 glycoside hydrolase family protein [Hyphomonas johnsonii MHS-2]
MANHGHRGALACAVALIMAGCSSVAPPESDDTADALAPAQETAAAAAPDTDVTLWPQVSSDLNSPAIEARIDALMAKMTLEQKVGQVIQADNGSITPEEVKQYRIGSVLSGGNSGPDGKPYGTIDEWVADVDAYYAASVDPEGVEVAIPIIWGIDAVHGHNNVIGGTLFPHNIGLGAMRDPDLMGEIARVTAIELRTTGHDWTFAPTVAVPRDDRWGRSYEGFGEDPEIVATYSGKIVEGLQGTFGSDEFLNDTHIISTAKHFLGDGGTTGGQDQGDTQLSEADLVRLHAAGYPPAIEAGALSVMASFSEWNGTKIHGDHYLLTDVLKNRMGFDGFIVGDWNAHGQIDGCTNDDCPAALLAGLDMYMAPDSWRGLYKNTLAEVKSGVIPQERLDDAVRRILRAKLYFGIFDQPRPSERPLAGRADLLGTPEHRAVARQAVRESLVLLKNQGGVLPIRPDAKVLVAGEGADNIAKQAGGWSLTWQGGVTDAAAFPNAQSILDGIREAGSNVTYSLDGSYTDRPDVAIVVFGEDPYAEFRGDIVNVAYDLDGTRELVLLQKLKAEGIPVVSVFLSGRPLWVNRELNASDAFVAAWLPGSEGGGVADLLIGDAEGAPRFDFRGRLSFSWPRRADQTPLNVGDADYDPLFTYGYGLTYAAPAAVGELDESVAEGIATANASSTFFENGDFAAGWTAMIFGDVTQARVDHMAQEDALLFRFAGTGQGDVAFSDGTPRNYLRESNGDIELAITMKSDVDGRVEIGMRCDSDDCASFQPLTATQAAANEWTEVRVSLSCFSDLDLTSVLSPFSLRVTGAGSVAVSDVRFLEDADAQETCLGE